MSMVDRRRKQGCVYRNTKSNIKIELFFGFGIGLVNKLITDKRMSSMNAIIQLIRDPEWSATVQRFFIEYPEFQEYRHLVPLRPKESIPYDNVKTLFESIVHYIASAGVRYTYAYNQYQMIYQRMQVSDPIEILKELETDPKVQPKKRPIYSGLASYMTRKGLTTETLRMEHMKDLAMSVKGIGPGCVAWCKKYFTQDDDCIEYTDINFMKGFKVLYGEHKLKDRKLKSDEWKAKGFGRLVNVFVQNIEFYAVKK
jgi:hypothetical protein